MKTGKKFVARAAANGLIDVDTVKSNCFGNNFVIYDGCCDDSLPETSLPTFSQQVTDGQFGIGADNLLVIQPCSAENLRAINDLHHYWDEQPRPDAEYLFRMFEPDGKEALCCGNGLMCIANYLFEKAGIEKARIVTEIPLASVRCTTIGVDDGGHRGWVNLGMPRKLPRDIRHQDPADGWIGDIQMVSDLRVKFRQHDLQPYAADTEIALSGYLIFTGEPHLVFLLDEDDSPIGKFSDAIFARSEGNRGGGPIFQRRHGFGTWLVDRIGQYLNAHYPERFPIGINVNFVRKNRHSGVIEYRCFERGIFRETLACGTGAMAVAFVSKHLAGVDDRVIEILPHRCRWFKPHAGISVVAEDQGWVLQGQPVLVAQIGYRFEPPAVEFEPATRRRAV